MKVWPHRQVFLPPSSSYLSVELDSQYGVGVGVVADLSSLLEVTDFELPGGLQADDSHQAAGEQTLHYIHIWTLHWEGQDIGHGLHAFTLKSNGSFDVSSHHQCIYRISNHEVKYSSFFCFPCL